MERAGRSVASPKAEASPCNPSLDTDVRYAKGVGERLAKVFGRLEFYGSGSPDALSAPV